MHLYLSSYDVGHEPHRLASLVRSPRALIVANALDNVGDQRTAFVHSQARALASLGIAAEELDLRDHFVAPGGIARRLDGVGLVWVTGGNAFLLRRAMRQSGFDAYLLSRRDDDDLVYGGFSAGACVAGPTLRGLERVDAVDATAAGYVDGVVWDGTRSRPLQHRSALPIGARRVERRRIDGGVLDRPQAAVRGAARRRRHHRGRRCLRAASGPARGLTRV
jgi:dipeptidase E